jgi:hypothetical protein
MSIRYPGPTTEVPIYLHTLANTRRRRAARSAKVEYQLATDMKMQRPLASEVRVIA